MLNLATSKVPISKVEDTVYNLKLLSYFVSRWDDFSRCLKVPSLVQSVYVDTWQNKFLRVVSLKLGIFESFFLNEWKTILCQFLLSLTPSVKIFMSIFLSVRVGFTSFPRKSIFDLISWRPKHWPKMFSVHS